MSHRVTATDVAKAAGVSQSAVSLVMSDKWKGRVGAAVADRILQVAAAMGYQPNVAARNLRRGVSGSVLLAVPALTNPFFAAVHSGAARVADANLIGLVVFPVDSDEDPGPFRSPHQAIDGVLACSLNEHDAQALSAGLPLVLLDEQSSTDTPSVTFEVVQGVADAVAHLAGLGHRHVLHVRAERDLASFRQRSAAFLDEISRRPGMIGEELSSSFNLAEVCETVMRKLSGEPRATAVFCDDDNIAMAVYAAAARLGLDVPRQLSVIGVNDLPIAGILHPPLTTVRLPSRELGRRGMQALLDVRDGKHADSVRLPVALEIRGSTAPPDQQQSTGS